MFHSFTSTEPKRKRVAAVGGAAAQAKTKIDEKRSEIEYHLETIRIFIRKIKGVQTLEKLVALEERLYNIFKDIQFNPRCPNCEGCNQPDGPAPGQTAHMERGGCLASSCDSSSDDDSSSDED